MSESFDKGATEPPFDGRRLFRVAIEFPVVVLAHSARDAEDLAREQIREIENDMMFNDGLFSAYQVNAVAKDWNNAIPYGERTPRDLTCHQILEEIRAYEETRPLTQEELEAAGQMRLSSQ